MSFDQFTPPEVFVVEEAEAIQLKNRLEQKREIHELNDELVEAVEKSKMHTDDKADFLLTKAGFKPASVLLFAKEFFTDADLQEIIDLAKKSDLKFTTVEDDTPNQETTELYLANEKADLDILVKAWGSYDRETIGKIVGYPATAVEAYVGTHPQLPQEEMTPEFLNSDAIVFLTPTLSQEHWKQEVEEGKTRAEFLKRIAPRIYQAVLDERAEHKMLNQDIKGS